MKIKIRGFCFVVSLSLIKTGMIVCLVGKGLCRHTVLQK